MDEQKIVVFLPKTLTDRQRSFLDTTVRRNREKMELHRVLLVTKNDALAFTMMMRILRELKSDVPVHFVGRFVGPTELRTRAKSLPRRKRIHKNRRAWLEGKPGIDEEAI